MNLNIDARLSLLDSDAVANIANDSRALASDIPFRIQGTDEFMTLLRDYGCEIDGEAVRVPKTVVERVFDRMAAEKSAMLGSTTPAAPAENENRVSVFTHGQALHVCDASSNLLRPARKADLESWCRLVDALDISERSHPTFIPQDVPMLSASFHAFATIILNSKKPHRVSVYSQKMLPFFIEAWKLSNDPDRRTTPVFATKCWVNSPFMITRENIEIAMESRRLTGKPIEFGVMPVAGASTPVTIGGALTQNTAESICLSAFRLAIDDLLHPLAPTASILDMADASHRQSGPDLLLHAVAASEMHEYLTGSRTRPYLHTGVSAKVVSPQSLYEKALTAGMSFALGLRNLGVGCLAYSDVGAPVQLVLDTKMARHLTAHFADVSLDEDRIDIDDIRRVVPTGARYLESEHTAKYFRESMWIQNFIDHRPVLTWLKEPSDMVQSARDEAVALLANSENQCPLPDSNRRAIEELMREADRVALEK